jgi:enoyl-CoA hydratase/carnithine racemase
VNFETLNVRREGAVVFAEIEAPPMNLLGPELVRDLVSLIQRVETEDAVQVLVFTSADPDYFISHVDVTRIVEYRHEAASTPNWNVATACPSSFLRRHGAEQLCFITISRAELARRVGAVV